MQGRRAIGYRGSVGMQEFVKSIFDLNSGLGLKLSDGKLLSVSRLVCPQLGKRVEDAGISSRGRKVRIKK